LRRKLLITLVALCPLSSTFGHKHFEIEDLLTHNDENKQDKVVLKIKGPIAYPLAMEVRDAFKKYKDRPTFIFDLDSNGGSTKEGEKIIAMMRKMRSEGKTILTVVDNGQNCGSMCVPVYLQGERRYAGEVSAWFFHGVTRSFSNVPIEARTRALLNIFIDAGVSEKWLDKMWERKAFSTPGEYWMSGTELHKEKSGIITHLRGRHRTYEPVELPFDPQIRPR
jgi:ATP-dependent protease ClpP protease subunit